MQHIKKSDLNDAGLVQLDGVEIENWPVSKQSKFSDDRWILDGDGVQGRRTLKWTTPLRGGVEGSLIDEGREDLLNTFKIAFYLWVNRPLDGNSVGTLRLRLQSCNLLAAWMIKNHIQDLSQLTAGELWGNSKPLEDGTYPSFVLDVMGGDPKQISSGSAMSHLSVLTNLFDLGGDLERLNVKPLSINPFAYHDVWATAQLIGKKKKKSHRPIPDEIAIPMLNEAYKWLDQRAEDVIQITEKLYDITRESVEKGQARTHTNEKRLKFLADFEFSEINGEIWHQKLAEPYDYKNPNTGKIEHQHRTINGGLIRLAELVRTVESAALIIIQQSSGMRVNELVNLEAGWSEDGMPACLEEREVSDGLQILTVLKGTISKVNDGFREEHEWVVGAVPNYKVYGLPDAPKIPVKRAVEVLLRLTDTMRQFKDIPEDIASKLCLSGASGLAHSGTSVVWMSPKTVNSRYQDFFETQLGDVISTLPDNSPSLVQDGWLGEWRESKGRLITSHMMRKLFANFAYSSDPSLLTAIRDQYGHVSVAMTMEYANNNYQVRDLNVLEAESGINEIIKVLFCNDLAGIGGEKIQNDSDWGNLRREFEAASPEDQHEVIHNWMTQTGRMIDEEYADLEDGKKVKKRAIKSSILNDNHALCAGISTDTSDMECHKAGGTVHPLNNGQGPNKNHRSLKNCLGCINVVIMHSSHGPFWRDEFLSHSEMVEINSLKGWHPNQAHAHDASAKRAKKILKKIGTTDAEIKEMEVEAKNLAEKEIEKLKAGGML